MGEEERSTAAAEQQDECEDYAVDVTTASSWYKNVSYDDAKIFIRTNIESAARSFIAIGYYLKLIRDGKLYREEGHESIWDFAMAEYGISKSTASRYMSMNDRFSLDGNSPIVDQKYKDFEKSKLQEMLSLTDEQLEQVTPEMKVQEIRAMRQPKEIPYFELEGQMDLETDFPEILPGTQAAPTVVQQPAAIQTTMTLEEMMGGEELEEQPEKLSAYGTPKWVYPEGSLLAEPSCEGGHYCFSCAEMDCEIRGKERQCWYAPCGNPFPCEIVADRPLDLLTEQMGDRCKFVNQDLAYHCVGTGEAAPCCSRCENPCEWACERATAEKGEPEVVATSQQETPSPVLETAALPLESAAEKQRSGKCLHNPLYNCNLADEDKITPGTGEDCTHCCCWECPKHGDCGLECYASKRREVFDTDADQEDTAEPLPEPPEYDRELLTGMIFDQRSQLEQMGDGWKRNVPQAYTKHRMMLRAYEMLLEERDAADQEQEVVVQPELPVLRNNEQRAAFIDNYESWPLWIETQETGERYYRYDLPDGTSFVVRTYHHMRPDYVSGIGVRYTEGYGANEQYILKPGKFFRDCQANRSAMIEKLKELQKGER